MCVCVCAVLDLFEHAQGEQPSAKTISNATFLFFIEMQYVYVFFNE